MIVLDLSYSFAAVNISSAQVTGSFRRETPTGENMGYQTLGADEEMSGGCAKN